MKHCRRSLLLTRSSVRILVAVLALGRMAWGAGTVTNCTQADLQAALNGGGAVTFACGGTITLTNTIVIAQDTSVDANGFAVTLSGGNAVRLFQVNSNVAFSLNRLSLANGRYVGTNGASGGAPGPGQDAFGAGILNLGATVALTDCALTDHSSQGGSAGSGPAFDSPSLAGGNGFGAALCNLGGTMGLTNCLLAGNMALGGAGSPDSVGLAPGGRGLGAAIYSANGQVYLQGVSFTSNSAAGAPQVTAAGWMNVGGVAGEGFGGAIYVTNSELVLSGSVLDGNSANGGCSAGLGGALFLDRGSSGVVRLCRFIRNATTGVISQYHYFAGGDASGGAVFSAGALDVWGSTFSSNSCVAGGGNPAGVARGGALCSTNALVINGSTFDNNKVKAGNTYAAEYILPPAVPGQGGAIWSSGALAATNSTWAANYVAGGDGPVTYEYGDGPGGPGSGGALCVAGGQAVLVNVTIAGNRADGGSPSSPAVACQGGGLYNTHGTVIVRSSIIANSTSGGDLWGAVIDGGHNICSDGTAGFSAGSSLNQTDPMLGPLADHGGPTFTMALSPASPALEAIPSGFPPVDQRGISRPQGPLADIGAFETLAPGPGPVILSQPQGGTVALGTNVTLTVVATADFSLAFQWFKDGAAIAGATASSLVLTNIQAASAGGYWVDITAAGIQTNSQTAFLVMDSVPLITSLPTNVGVAVGGQASFTVAAQGPDLAYRWWHNDQLIPGATNATLVITNAQAGTQGSYTVEVSSFAGCSHQRGRAVELRCLGVSHPGAAAALPPSRSRGFGNTRCGGHGRGSLVLPVAAWGNPDCRRYQQHFHFYDTGRVGNL